MKIAVIGAGGLGGYFAAELARSGADVSVVARGDHLAAIRDRGLTVRNQGTEWNVRLPASDDATAIATGFGADDFAIVATKSYALDGARAAIAAFTSRGATAVPLLNGIDALERLTAMGVEQARLLGGLTYVSAARVGPGVVERRSNFCRVLLGSPHNADDPRADTLAGVLRAAGIEASAVPDVGTQLWKKFVFFTSVSAVCSLHLATIGDVRSTPAGRALIVGAISEVVSVARRSGVPLADDEEAQVERQILGLPPALKPSLLLDVEAGSETEIDVLSGAVARLARAMNLPAPIHAAAAAFVRTHRTGSAANL
jgi:2-dehydropantoate 2-reductase